MRFRVSAALDGDGVSPQPFEVMVGDLRVGVLTGDKSVVNGIWVDAPVPDYLQWLPSLTPGDGTRSNPHHMEFKEPPVGERLLELLQYIESLGSFWLGIHRIEWSTAKREWIAESPEERTHLPVFAISRSMSYERRPLPFEPALLAQLVVAEQSKRWLVIPMSFLREGQNDYEAHRYINAFYNFYFFIEDLYGQGKTKNRQILEMFKSSRELVAAARKAYSECATDPSKRESLANLMSRVGGTTTPNGLLEFLVAMRGELHHFSRKSTRPKGHPLNHHEFQPLAFFAMAVCLNVVPHLITRAEPGAYV